MNDSPCSAAVRRRRIITDAIVLLFLLALLVASLRFPIPTIGAALRAAQQEILFGPGEIVAEFTRNELPEDAPDFDRGYVLQWEGRYALFTFSYYDLSWHQWARPVVLEPSPDLPLTAAAGSFPKCVLIYSQTDSITRVEAVHPCLDSERRDVQPLTTSSALALDNQLFFLPLAQSFNSNSVVLDAVQLRGYDASGALVYESPVPSIWAEWYGITLSDSEGR